MSTQKISIFRINKNWTKTFKNSQKKISIMMSDLFLLFFRLKLNRKIFIFTIVKALSQRTSKITKNRFSKNSKKSAKKIFFLCIKRCKRIESHLENANVSCLSNNTSEEKKREKTKGIKTKYKSSHSVNIFDSISIVLFIR